MNKPLAIQTLTQTPTKVTDQRKVLHLINGEHFSGAERVQDLLALSLNHFKYEVGFACLKFGKFPQERQSQDNDLFSLNMRSKADFRAIRTLRKLVVENDYEILHAHTPRTVLVGSLVAKKLGRPLIYHVHSPVGKDSTRSITNRLNQMVEMWASQQVNHFICVSDSIHQYMRGLGYPAEKLTTVANGVQVVPNVPDRPTPSGVWTLGTTALFRPRKGTEMLLEALARLKKRDVPVRLLAVGPFETPEYEQKIKQLAAELDVTDMIEWTGFTSNVNEQFQRMDLFVLPSLFGEGLPMVILEAMALGVPIVAAEVEGVNQALRDEQDGLIFEPGSPAHLADRIEAMIEGAFDWQAIRSSALNRQRQMFSDYSMAEGVATVYEQVMEEHLANQNS